MSKLFEEGDTAIIDLTEGTVTNKRTGETLHGNKLSAEMIDILKAGGIDGVLAAKGYIKK